MQQFCQYGSVRGATGNRRPYRDISYTPGGANGVRGHGTVRRAVPRRAVHRAQGRRPRGGAGRAGEPGERVGSLGKCTDTDTQTDRIAALVNATSFKIKISEFNAQWTHDPQPAFRSPRPARSNRARGRGPRRDSRPGRRRPGDGVLPDRRSGNARQARAVHAAARRAGRPAARQRAARGDLARLRRLAVAALGHRARAGRSGLRRCGSGAQGRQLQRTPPGRARQLEDPPGRGVARDRRRGAGPALRAARRHRQGRHVRHVRGRPHGARHRRRALVAGAPQGALRGAHRTTSRAAWAWPPA